MDQLRLKNGNYPGLKGKGKRKRKERRKESASEEAIEARTEDFARIRRRGVKARTLGKHELGKGGTGADKDWAWRTWPTSEGNKSVVDRFTPE